jgi:hypothetical protein
MTIAVRSGGEAGVVTLADVNLKFIWDVVHLIKIGNKGKAYVLDGTGHLVADPDSNIEGRDKFFKWDKNLIERKQWAALPLASKAIFPVIAVHNNKMGECWPGQKTIADLSGHSEKTVREGIRGLKERGFSGIKVTKYKKQGMQWSSSHYYFGFPRAGEKGYFPFHKSLITSMKWSRIKPSAKALYPVMRFLGIMMVLVLITSLTIIVIEIKCILLNLRVLTENRFQLHWKAYYQLD